MNEPEDSADGGEDKAVPARLLTLAGLSDWGRTGATVVAIVGAAVTFVRWTATVDDRLSVIESGIAGQRDVSRQAVESTAQHAAEAAQAANRAEVAVTRAEAAVADNMSKQTQIVEGTAANRRSIETQGKKVDALKVEMKQQMEALAWRVRQLEEESRKALDHKTQSHD